MRHDLRALRPAVLYLVALAFLGGHWVAAPMARGVLAPLSTNVLVNDPTHDVFPHITQIEPTIAVSGPAVVVGWNDTGHSGGTVLGVGFGVGYGFSADGGATFTDAAGLAGQTWGADPTLAVDRMGRFYFARMDLNLGVAVHKSTDGGTSFAPGVSASLGLGGVQDSPFVAVDETGGPFDGTVYVSWTNADFNVLTIMFSRSTNGGMSFSTAIPLSARGLNQSSQPATGPDGEVYVTWVDMVSESLLLRRSADGGQSFGPERVITARSPIGSSQGCPGRSLKGDIRASRRPAIAVDRSQGPHRGNVYVAFASDPDGLGPDVADIFLTRSIDGGSTWSVPARVNDDASKNDQWAPFVAVAPDGTVGLTWYDRRLDDGNLLIDLFLAISRDGGASVEPNIRVTDSSFPVPPLKPNFDPLGSVCYMGSYNFMVAREDAFYLVWTDNRMLSSGIPDPNIFFAKMPLESLSSPRSTSQHQWGIRAVRSTDR